jgi:hypothetical protein
MTLLEFVAAHPWWTLVYLSIICLTAVFVSEGFGPLVVVKRLDNSKHGYNVDTGPVTSEAKPDSPDIKP